MFPVRSPARFAPHAWLPALWPLLAMLATVACWFAMGAQAERDRRLAERDAAREVRSYAEA
jgi:ABC-type dipeptide/oligopeptide/nickel transport system permease subunit